MHIKYFLYLCTRKRNYGSVAQLNRASDYGSEGYRFESCRSHKNVFIMENGSVAQLNRASDYGSEGYRFESCRSHKNVFIMENGSVAQLNRASDYGSEGYRFESCRSHKRHLAVCKVSFCLCVFLIAIINVKLFNNSGFFPYFVAAK